MQGSIDRTGQATLTWNICDGSGKLYSPDGLQHCLPCERCGQPQWVSLITVSVLCEDCSKAQIEEYCTGYPYPEEE